MIPRASHDTSFESLEPDKALLSPRLSREAPKIFGSLTRFCSIRQITAIFYIIVAVILFTGLVLSQDSLGEHHTIFDATAIIQTPPSASSSISPETSAPAPSPPPSQQQEGWDEGTPLANGIIIRHPLPSHEEIPPPQNSPPPPQTLSPSTASDQSPSTSSASPVPGSTAIQLHTGFAPSWATDSSERFNPSSLDLPESPHEKEKNHTKKTP